MRRDRGRKQGRRALLSLALMPVLGFGAAADEFDPSSLDLARMIACEMTARDYNQFAMWFAVEPDAPGKLGWTPVESDNPLLGQFALPQPIEVFGHEVDTIVFTGTGPLALLSAISPRELAASLGVTAVVDTPEKFLGEKTLLERTEEAGGATTETKVSLNVSTVDTHPGVTLAGCSYRIEVK